MTKKIIEKNIELSLEFDQYLNKHPDLYAKIPNGAHVFISIKGDRVFNASTENNIKNKSKVVEARKEGSKWTITPFVVA